MSHTLKEEHHEQNDPDRQIRPRQGQTTGSDHRHGGQRYGWPVDRDFKKALTHAVLRALRWNCLPHSFASLQLAAEANIKYFRTS
jgi:hypothetical protein